MKLIGFILLFLLSNIASAASYSILTGDDINLADGRISLTESSNPQSTSLTYASPAPILQGEYDGPPVYNENVFSNGSDLYFTPMGGDLLIDFHSDVNIEFEWFSNSITNGLFYFSGNIIPIVSGADGSFITSIPMGLTNIGFFGLAQSIDSSMGLTFTAIPPSPIPLPAAFWLFAPALLGFMGFRKVAATRLSKI